MTKTKTKRLLEKALSQAKELEASLRVIEFTIGGSEDSAVVSVIGNRLEAMIKLKCGSKKEAA